MRVLFDNRLEALGDALFRELGAYRADDAAAVLARRDCVVTPSRILQAWLRQRYLYGADGGDGPRPRILTHCDFPLVNLFVNDWLYRMDRPDADGRMAAAHPFAVESMRWRIFVWLRDSMRAPHPVMEPLRTFLNAAGNHAGRLELRRFQLAGRIAAVFDSYMVYRPEMLARWERGRAEEVPAALQWEPELWRQLTRGVRREQTYPAAFRRMGERLRDCRIAETYTAIHVFCPAMLPRVYQVFFQALGEILPVHLYLFNPSPTDWIAVPSAGRAAREEGAARLDAADEDPALHALDNPLLAGLGRGIHELLGELLDLTEGDPGERAGDDEAPSAAGTVLAALQSGVAANRADFGSGAGLPRGGCASVQVHACHSPRREVEALRDHILDWCTRQGWQPRQIQVQVSDMALYAPYIESVFATRGEEDDETIPYAIADRIRAGESAAAEGFLRLLHLADSRFTASDLMELLQCDSLRNAMGIAAGDLATIQRWLTDAGIRWGRDRQHRKRETRVEFSAATSWRYGLDRLLKGYALGRDEDASGRPPSPCDRAEGDDALVLGRLADFFDRLEGVADLCGQTMPLSRWVEELNRVTDDFFLGDNETYRDIAAVREAVEALRVTALAGEATDEATGMEAVRAFLQAHLQGATGGDDMNGNAVVFSALRPGSSAPRAAMCLLGMGDSAFPRQDNRPAYDLLRVQRKRCDRTPRIEDRAAFLEALMAARDVLYVSYTGFSAEDGSALAPSVLIRELLDFVGETRVRRVTHKLQAFHADYFDPAASLFSYSRENCAAARQRALRHAAGAVAPTDGDAAPVGPTAVPDPVEMDDLIRFFENPARHYFEQTLGIRLERPEESLADAEEFAPETLTAYQVREAVIEALIEPRADDAARVALRERLTDRGLLPLAHWGVQWFDRHWAEIEELMAARPDGLGTLGVALAARRAAPRAERRATLACTVAVGETAHFGSEAQPLALDFHAANERARRKIASYLRHVFACAVGIGETRYCVEGKKPDKLSVTVFDPIDTASARAQLQTFVEMFARGLRHPLPFAPETSLAYCRAESGAAVEPADPAALEAAEKAWRSDRYRRGERDDPYLRRAFGEAGPMRKPSFAEIARTICGALPARQRARSRKARRPAGEES